MISIQPALINIGSTCPSVVDVVLLCVWQGATHVKHTEIGDSTTAERFRKPITGTSDQATSYSLLVAQEIHITMHI